MTHLLEKCVLKPWLWRVWKRFIFPPWQQTTTLETADASMMDTEGSDTVGSSTSASNLSEKWIDFTDDDGEALLIILRILHLQFKKVPTTISSTCLLQLAKLCDQYQCTGSLQPWIQSWMWSAKKEDVCIKKEQWLFIYWAFGQEEDFGSVAKDLVQLVRTDAKGEYLTMDGELLPEPTPDRIIESILAQRLIVIRKLLDTAYKWTTHLSQKTINRKPICEVDEPECHSMIYGSLLFGLQEVELWPQLTPESIELNVKELAQQIKTIPIRVPRYHGMCGDKLHLERDVDSILTGGIANPALDCHIIHMSTIRECL